MATVVAGAADLRRRPKQGAGLARVAVRLAEMDAIRTQPFGQRNAVVDDESAVMVRAQPLQRFGKPRQPMLSK